MKVGSPGKVIDFFNKVNSKEEKDGFDDHLKQQLDRQKKDEQEEPVDITDEKVNEALEAFSKDKAAIDRGISAMIVGNGPGLHVVLKDDGGNVLRQLSGEEFLKLRESVKSEMSSTRGRLLDRKV